MESKTYLGRYRITLDQYEQPIRLRREGGASTYKAFDSQSSREVALEIVPAGSVRISVQSQLAEEAESAKKLQQINVPMLYDFGIEDNQLIYATELVDGVSAEDWVKTHGPMPMGPALRIASQVVKAVGAATFHGIFHHALNPSNIMIVPGQTAEGEWPLIKVMNFVGVAPSYSRETATDANVSDKINFIAPEQLESGNANFSSEIYSLGCTLWFLLSGVPPLAGAATVDGASRVPAPVRGLISRMLAVDPNDRPRDPLALHEQIEDCIAEVENKRVVLPPAKIAKPAPAPVAPVVKPTEVIDARPHRPFPWQPLAVAAALLLFAGLAAMLLPQLFRMRGGKGEIGVQVGVPDSVAMASPKPSAPNAAISAAPIQPNEHNGTEVAAAPGVLTSTAGGSENTEADAANVPNSSATEAEPVQVASNSVPPQQPSAPPEESAAPVIASNSRQAHLNEPAPPSEGPENVTATPPSEPVVAYTNTSPDEIQSPATTPAPAQSPARIARNDENAREVKKSVEKPAVVAKESRRITKVDRPVAATRRLRDGRVRAQYLGTNSDGEMVFGLPSDERAYLKPNGVSSRRESGQRRRRAEVRPAEPADDLPVLPALPPDE